MALLFATFLYWLRLVRRPMHIRLKQRYVGSSAICIIGFGLVELWGRRRHFDRDRDLRGRALSGVAVGPQQRSRRQIDGDDGAS